MSTSSHKEDRKGITFRRAFVIVNPLWLEMKLKYLNIANTLDPNFSEEEFKRGAKQVRQFLL